MPMVPYRALGSWTVQAVLHSYAEDALDEGPVDAGQHVPCEAWVIMGLGSHDWPIPHAAQIVFGFVGELRGSKIQLK
jgi:hypothetical protein